MIRLPSFLDALAAYDGRPRATIEVVARVLRDAGWLPPSKRGVGASHVTAAEAANLLIACLASDSPAAGPRAVEVYRGLRMRRRARAGMCPAIDAIRKSETFGEALETFFDHLAGLPSFAGLMLTLSRPVPYAELSAVNEMGEVIWHFDWVVDVKLHASGHYANEIVGRPEKRIAASFSETALIGLANLVTGSIAGKDLPR